MALELQVSTSHRIDASYWRIENIEIKPVVNIGIAYLEGHKNWTQAGGPEDDPDRDRPQKVAESLRSFTFTFTGQEYQDHVSNISDSNQVAEAYNAIKQRGTPDSGADVDFSQATDV